MALMLAHDIRWPVLSQNKNLTNHHFPRKIPKYSVNIFSEQ
jgi:hypothetical protein